MLGIIRVVIIASLVIYTASYFLGFLIYGDGGPGGLLSNRDNELNSWIAQISLLPAAAAVLAAWKFTFNSKKAPWFLYGFLAVEAVYILASNYLHSQYSAYPSGAEFDWLYLFVSFFILMPTPGPLVLLIMGIYYHLATNKSHAELKGRTGTPSK